MDILLLQFYCYDNFETGSHKKKPTFGMKLHYTYYLILYGGGSMMDWNTSKHVAKVKKQTLQIAFSLMFNNFFFICPVR